MAKVSCILRHRDVQLILAYSLTRSTILAADKGRGEGAVFFSVSSVSFMFLSPLPLSSPLLSSISLLISSGR